MRTIEAIIHKKKGTEKQGSSKKRMMVQTNQKYDKKEIE